ncbi:MAG: PHP-associated domain-containing protein [Terriglobales bacterium]
MRRARHRHADVVIVTDHDSIRGSVELSRLAQGNPRFVVVGGEYKTEKGDIIGLFLKHEIEARQSQDVVREIKQQGGLILLPHPYKGHRLDGALLAAVDLVETFNARCSPTENARADELARSLNKPGLAGCDAHCAAELQAVVNEFDATEPEDEEELRRSLLAAPRRFLTHEVSRVYQPYSQMIKAYKTRDIRLFLHQIKRMASLVVEGT